ncbi:TPA: hypothetical protein RQL23_004405 [Vibrio vulnificus]|nr:hypothetical protein [Vibrio vulnificus]
MAKLNTEVAISKIPELVISQAPSTDWVAVGSIIVTALVVIGTTYITVKNLNKTIKLQKDLSEDQKKLEFEKSRAEMLSRNRQEWINSLRDCISEYMGQVQSLDTQSKLLDSKLKQYQKFSLDQGITLTFDLYNELSDAETKAWATRTRIKLYLNPKEELSKNLMVQIDTLYEVAKEQEIRETGHVSFWQALEKAEVITQEILKTEWERVKAQV